MSEYMFDKKHICQIESQIKCQNICQTECQRKCENICHMKCRRMWDFLSDLKCLNLCQRGSLKVTMEYFWRPCFQYYFGNVRQEEDVYDLGLPLLRTDSLPTFAHKKTAIWWANTGNNCHYQLGSSIHTIEPLHMRFFSRLWFESQRWEIQHTASISVGIPSIFGDQ